MYYASSPALAAAASAAGAFGMIAAGIALWHSYHSSAFELDSDTVGFSSSEQLKQELREIRSILQTPEMDSVPVGVGLLGWILDYTETSEDPRIRAVLDEMPQAIWLAFGEDLGKYVAQIRAYDTKRDRKTVIFVVANSLEAALRAKKQWEVDVIVAQGINSSCIRSGVLINLCFPERYRGWRTRPRSKPCSFEFATGYHHCHTRWATYRCCRRSIHWRSSCSTTGYGRRRRGVRDALPLHARVYVYR